MKSFCELVRLEKHLICQFDETRLEGGSHGRGFCVRVSLANERVLPSQISTGTLLVKCQKGRFYLSGLRLVIFFFLCLWCSNLPTESLLELKCQGYIICHVHLEVPLCLKTVSKDAEFVLAKLVCPCLIWAVWTLLGVGYHTWSQPFWWLLACVLGTYVDKSKAGTPRLDQSDCHLGREIHCKIISLKCRLPKKPC